LAGDPDDAVDNATYVHFGPGVPVPKPSAPDRATALWRGEIGARRCGRRRPAIAWRRRTQRWILPLTVLILVIAVLIYSSGATRATRPRSASTA
jgi:hypothetical protein